MDLEGLELLNQLKLQSGKMLLPIIGLGGQEDSVMTTISTVKPGKPGGFEASKIQLNR